MDNGMAKKMVILESVAAWLRHASAPVCSSFLQELQRQLKGAPAKVTEKLMDEVATVGDTGKSCIGEDRKGEADRERAALG